MTIFHVGDLKCKENLKSLNRRLLHVKFYLTAFNLHNMTTKPQRVFNFIIVTIFCCFLPSKFTLGPDERSAIVFLLASLLPWSLNSKSPGITLTSKEPRDPRRSLMSLQRRRPESEARLFIFSIFLFIIVDHFMILVLWLQTILWISIINVCLSVQSKLRSVYWPRSICFVVRWARRWRGRHIGRRHISNVLLKTIHIYFKDHPTLISVCSHVLIPAVISYLGVNHSRPPASSDVGRGGSTVVCQVGLQNE